VAGILSDSCGECECETLVFGVLVVQAGMLTGSDIIPLKQVNIRKSI